MSKSTGKYNGVIVVGWIITIVFSVFLISEIANSHIDAQINSATRMEQIRSQGGNSIMESFYHDYGSYLYYKALMDQLFYRAMTSFFIAFGVFLITLGGVKNRG